jgi:hypothetical protein
MRYSFGIVVESVVLAKGRNRMRVAAAGFPDTIELKRSGPQWFTATRQAVEFDFVMSNAHPGEGVRSSRPSRVVRTAAQTSI